jgi:hypothetical protein
LVVTTALDSISYRSNGNKIRHSSEDDMTIAIEKPALSSAVTKFLDKEHRLLIDGKWIAAKRWVAQTSAFEVCGSSLGSRSRTGG